MTGPDGTMTPLWSLLTLLRPVRLPFPSPNTLPVFALGINNLCTPAQVQACDTPRALSEGGRSIISLRVGGPSSHTRKPIKGQTEWCQIRLWNLEFNGIWTVPSGEGRSQLSTLDEHKADMCDRLGGGTGGPGTQGQRPNLAGRAPWAEKVAGCLWNIPAQERQAEVLGHSVDRQLKVVTGLPLLSPDYCL